MVAVVGGGAVAAALVVADVDNDTRGGGGGGVQLVLAPWNHTKKRFKKSCRSLQEGAGMEKE